jgi:hypothetical protein
MSIVQSINSPPFIEPKYLYDVYQTSAAQLIAKVKGKIRPRTGLEVPYRE